MQIFPRRDAAQLPSWTTCSVPARETMHFMFPHMGRCAAYARKLRYDDVRYDVLHAILRRRSAQHRTQQSNRPERIARAAAGPDTACKMTTGVRCSASPMTTQLA